jgi:Nif-specific regulatory protein
VPQPSPSLIPDRVARERDLYRRLLEIARHEEPDPLLTDALGLVTDVTGAEQGYLEMTDEHGRPSWWTAVGLSESEIAGAKRRISRSIIADAIASGETVCVPSALLDESYGSTDSVRTASIGAVCCAPIGHPPQGVLYIQQDAARGWFDEETRRLVQLVCEHLAPALDRVLERRPRPARPTRRPRCAPGCSSTGSWAVARSSRRS